MTVITQGPMRTPVDDVDEPLVSVVIPVKNEASRIVLCLRAVLAQDWPPGRMEVIVVDGQSDDGTPCIAARVLKGRGLARAMVIDNQVGTRPSNLNMGLDHVRGQILCRVDARSMLPSGYIRRCAETLTRRPDVVAVGGRQFAVPTEADSSSPTIARALNNRYSTGLSRYRRSRTSGPADTVYLGSYRSDEVRKAGGWDETLGMNEDFDLNRRMRKLGIIWFDASIQVAYLPRTNRLDLFEQYRRFGRWKVEYWTATGDAPRPRQIALLLAMPGSAFAGAGLVWWAGRRFGLGGICGAISVGAGALGAVDALGSDEEAGIVLRMGAVLATACVGFGWTVGVWEAVARHLWTQRNGIGRQPK